MAEFSAERAKNAASSIAIIEEAFVSAMLILRESGLHPTSSIRFAAYTLARLDFQMEPSEQEVLVGTVAEMAEEFRELLAAMKIEKEESAAAASVNEVAEEKPDES